jgi:hypothetical protein
VKIPTSNELFTTLSLYANQITNHTEAGESKTHASEGASMPPINNSYDWLISFADSKINSAFISNQSKKKYKAALGFHGA